MMTHICFSLVGNTPWIRYELLLSEVIVSHEWEREWPVWVCWKTLPLLFQSCHVQCKQCTLVSMCRESFITCLLYILPSFNFILCSRCCQFGHNLQWNWSTNLLSDYFCDLKNAGVSVAHCLRHLVDQIPMLCSLICRLIFCWTWRCFKLLYLLCLLHRHYLMLG